MSALTLKNIPEELLEELRERAAAEHRSLNGEILFRLKMSLQDRPASREGMLREEAAIQADAWEKMAGRWTSELSAAEEIDSLYAARSAARNLDLTW